MTVLKYFIILHNLFRPILKADSNNQEHSTRTKFSHIDLQANGEVGLKELAGKAVSMLYENKDRQTMSKITRVNKGSSMRVAIPAMGGLIVKE